MKTATRHLSAQQVIEKLRERGRDVHDFINAVKRGEIVPLYEDDHTPVPLSEIVPVIRELEDAASITY